MRNVLADLALESEAGRADEVETRTARASAAKGTKTARSRVDADETANSGAAAKSVVPERSSETQRGRSRETRPGAAGGRPGKAARGRPDEAARPVKSGKA
jgi:hypothetical protein